MARFIANQLTFSKQNHMSFFGMPIRNGVSIGLGSVISFLSGYADATVQNNLLTEIGDNLVQEDGGLILLE